MIKVSTFSARNELGYTAIPLFGKADQEFEKRASVHLLPPVLAYIATLRPANNSQYVLINALGAGEYFSSNINGDWFPEAALMHAPDDWSGNPVVDSIRAKTWPYGFPTFYNAHPYAHHKNKNPGRAYGSVELALWNDRMKRVELVARVDHDKCVQYGGVPVWDKLKAGLYPDTSMGAKVPFDTSSITLDWKLYREAQSTFDPKKHRHPGIAVLEFHKRLKEKDGVGIRGVSITRDDYDEYCLRRMNEILPDGRKVFVYNDYPNFFDISFVFMGADQTSKVMVYVVKPPVTDVMLSVKVAEDLGYVDADAAIEKAASIPESAFIAALIKGAEKKKAEIEKQIMPTQLAAKAVPVLAGEEPDLSPRLLNMLAARPLDEALSTVSGLCIVLKPREFQRIVLVREGKAPLADLLDSQNMLFPRSDQTDDSLCLSPDKFLPALAHALLSVFDSRTAMAPTIERRVLVMGNPDTVGSKASSHAVEELRKIGAAYNTYRTQLLSMAPYAPLLTSRVSPQGDLSKLAEARSESVFTPLSYLYMANAHLDDLPFLEGAAVQQCSQYREEGQTPFN